MAVRYAVDTNVLLRLSHQNDPFYGLIQEAVRRLVQRQVELCYTPQNVGELWNANTRPLDRNGLGLSIEETESRTRFIETSMTLLPEDGRVYECWRNLLLSCEVRGVQVHDAHLAAALEVHVVRNLLTFNGADFKRFPFITAVHPRDVTS
jgi:predicted nucleic acid-binding protein